MRDLNTSAEATKPKGTRRIGNVDTESRKLLLRAAEELMREEGYAQVTSRKLASRAGLKPQSVHYYFRTMDDLFEELFNQAIQRQLAALDWVTQQPDPLVALFELTCDPTTAALQLEFLALANHRKRLQTLIREFGAQLNAREAAILDQELRRRHIATAGFSPEQLATLFQTAARGLAFSGSFNSERFSSARDAVVAWLRSTFDQDGLAGNR